jgi:hypothetical protein
MILLKSRPKCSPTHFPLNLMHKFYCEKSSHKSLAHSVIFKHPPKENNRQIGEKSPNLVTLLLREVSRAAG